MKPFTNEILPQGYKMTELGALPEEWEVVVFEKCIKNEASKVGKVKQQEYKVYGKYPIIDQGQSLIAGYCDNEKYVYEGRLPVIIFGDHTRILKFINFPFVTGADGTKVLIPNTSVILPEFFYFALLNIKIPNRGYNRHYSLLREQKLPLPPLPEQKKIATVLSAMQEAKEKTQVVIDATKALKKSMMKHLFTYGPVSPQEAENVPLKETEIGMVPEEWDVVRLGDVVIKNKGIQRGPWGGSIKKEIFVPVGYAVYEQGNVISGNITDFRYFIDKDKFEELKNFKVKAGDILITAAGTLGKLVILPNKIHEGVINQALIIIRIDEQIINKIYFRYLFNLIVEQGIIASYSHGATLKNLSSIRVLRNIRIPLPPLPVQQKIASILSAIDEKIEAEENKKKALEELFKSLLHNLMTAKIRVNQLEISS